MNGKITRCVEVFTLVPEAFFWQILRRKLLFLFFLLAQSAESAESLWSRPLGTSLSCYQLLTIVSDWRIFLIALRVIRLGGLNISSFVICQKKMKSLTAVKC